MKANVTKKTVIFVETNLSKLTEKKNSKEHLRIMHLNFSFLYKKYCAFRFTKYANTKLQSNIRHIDNKKTIFTCVKVFAVF